MSPLPWFPPVLHNSSLVSPESVSLISHFTQILGSRSASRRIQLKAASKQKYRPTLISMYEFCCCLYASHHLRACRWLSCLLSAYSQGHSWHTLSWYTLHAEGGLLQITYPRLLCLLVSRWVHTVKDIGKRPWSSGILHLLYSGLLHIPVYYIYLFLTLPRPLQLFPCIKFPFLDYLV